MEEPNAICDSKLPGIFPRQESASSLMSVAITRRSGRSSASVTATHRNPFRYPREYEHPTNRRAFYDSENFGIHFARLLFPVFRKSSASDTRPSVDGRGINPRLSILNVRPKNSISPVMYITGSNSFADRSILKFLPVRRRELVSAMRKKPSAVFPEEGRKQNLRILAGIPEPLSACSTVTGCYHNPDS